MAFCLKPRHLHPAEAYCNCAGALLKLKSAFDSSALMAKTVPLGSHGTCEERVKFDNTLSAHHHELPAVYSTPDMIRLMETAGFYALRPYCEAGEISVGTAINVEHRAPAGVNSVVKAEAVVESSDGRFYILRVKAVADNKEIGSGTITRVIVQTDSFLAKNGIAKQ